MKLHGGSWSSTEVHEGSVEAPWRSPWRSLEVHGAATEHGVPWKSPRRLIEFRGALHGGSWSSMELRGGLYGVTDIM